MATNTDTPNTQSSIADSVCIDTDHAARAHRFIGDSWMGWAALYAILLLLDQLRGV